MTELKNTHLSDIHRKLGAKMMPFAGFYMPVQYSSIIEEVKAVRQHVGVFDVSHMGEFFVEGPDTYNFIDFIVSNDVKNVEIGKAVYSPLCREDGSVVDDLIVYKLEEAKALICVNASNIEKDWDHIQKYTNDFDVTMRNASDDYSLLALQGPDAEKTLSCLGFEKELENFEYYSAKKIKISDFEFILARTGYTGEDGFEIFGCHAGIEWAWEKLMTAGVTPCGLASRDVLRLEVAYPLYGHEIHDEVTPLDSALKWTVKLTKDNFVGLEALRSYEPKFRLVKLSIEKGVPRQGYTVENEQGVVIGKITSGSHSVATGRGICLAHVEKINFPSDKKFFINIRNRRFEATYHAKAFVQGGHK